ncbi:MAG: Glycerol-1-phosphate dehydrogenase (NAD(P)+) [Chloroflexi bacterium ADurb.Bin325]|nr:MAG: Glycerol-1-phosphate dehydrogenase (NAD(P)+) [Chloroflexi bacterium ADurb.Bin325]
MSGHPRVYIGPDAVNELIAFCRANGHTHLALIADDNTYRALGARVETACRQVELDVRTVIVKGDDIGADDGAVYQVLLGLDKSPRTFLAVGSGTITDVTRFVSHRSNADFISVPTAPSVDGFTSIGAPMIVNGVKVTIMAQGPLAVFADLPTLCAAPAAMLAAGFGDMIAKLTSIADWELGHLFWDEPYDPAIAARARKAAWDCARSVDALAARECAGVERLIDGLIESGLCMLDFGETRPASGYEHHVSHYLEMKLLWEGRHSVLHGAKVGLGVLTSARLYDQIRRLDRADVVERLEAAELPPAAEEIARIEAAYGPQADDIIALHAPFIHMTQSQFAALKARILEQWPAAQEIAARVPSADEVTDWLNKVGGATTPAQLGLSDEETATARAVGHYYRNRFSVKKLARILDLS